MTAGTPGVFGRRPSTVRPAVGRFLAGRERFQSALVGLGVLALSLLAGAAVLDPRWSELVLPGIGLSVLVGIAAMSRGALVGLTLLGVFNGIPGLDLDALAVPGSFRPSDLLIAFLIGAARFLALHDPRRPARGPPLAGSDEDLGLRLPGLVARDARPQRVLL